MRLRDILVGPVVVEREIRIAELQTRVAQLEAENFGLLKLLNEKVGDKMDIVAGSLEVGTNGNGEVVINHPDLQPDENGVGHIVFSPKQARHLADSLRLAADRAAREPFRVPEFIERGADEQT